MAEAGGQAGGGYQVPGFSKGLRLIELLCAARQPLGVSELSQNVHWMPRESAHQPARQAAAGGAETTGDA